MARNNHSAERHPVKEPRASWRGLLRIDLVSFAVEAINAIESGKGEVHFHQLHASCHNRIRYQKTCPVHGAVDNDEIVLGYEYKKGAYVEVDPEETSELRTEREKALSIDSFIPADELDPIYFDGRTYYLVPDGSEAQEPYRVICTALAKANRYGIGQVVMSAREQMVALRPEGERLLMSMLHRDTAFRSADDLGISHGKVEPKKLKLAQLLIDSSTELHFKPEQYPDRYETKLDELIQAKIKGEEIVAPEEEAEPEVINLMDALRKSVAKTHKRGAESATRKAAHSKAPPRTRRRSKKAS